MFSFCSLDNTPTTLPAGQTIYSYKYSSETRENKYGQPNTGYTGASRPVHHEQLPLRRSPFPRDELDTTPGLQSPPKRLDDLMASFGDRTDYSTYHNSNKEYHTNVKSDHYQSRSRDYENDKSAEYTIPIKKTYFENKGPENNKGPTDNLLQTEVKETEITQSKAGPPVFYPPGSTTFVKKEEVMHQVQISRTQGDLKNYIALKTCSNKNGW